MKTALSRSLARILCALMLALPCSSRAFDELLPLFDSWRYADNGVDQGTAWREPDFPDTDFQDGISKFGFGDGDEFTTLQSAPGGIPLNTAYFRREINVPNPGIYGSISIFMLRDDGAIVYLNGVEVFRSNMPTGAVNYATKALHNVDGFDEFSTVKRTIPASMLLPGRNVIAVEVHQAEGGDEDMGFALAIIGHFTSENQPPTASSAVVITEPDLATNITLNAVDPEGNPLSYSIITAPQNGTLSGEPPNLTYTPAPGFIGTDSFTFLAFDGEWVTEIAEISIGVQIPSNHPPTADDQSVTVGEDTTLAIIVTASDVDGDTLTYSFTQPAHGTVNATGNTVIYQPAANYNGPDSFTFTVDDGNDGIATATVSVTVTSVNDAPTALAAAASAADPTNFVRNLVVVATNNQDATVLLNGIASDVDGNGLTYAWFEGANPTPFSTEGSPTVTLPVGNYAITLVVSDGVVTVSDTITVQVFTPCDIVKDLVAEVKAAGLKSSESNGLLGHLNAACSTFGNGNIAAGVHQLQLFKARVDSKVAPGNPALALSLNASAQAIIDEVTGQ